MERSQAHLHLLLRLSGLDAVGLLQDIKLDLPNLQRAEWVAEGCLHAGRLCRNHHPLLRRRTTAAESHESEEGPAGDHVRCSEEKPTQGTFEEKALTLYYSLNSLLLQSGDVSLRLGFAPISPKPKIWTSG
ncbi:hypothetical protein RvY_13752-2 [Ramazzottius varieornatus]|uniref:Uncharacterized protein n=1 Tax=Ramazzottius varieornatus TaxID=947166 RepID=A0A1D1VU70_RAMVA|nr:hypothetical protein RvY_13752-2 [Ramazzottius varieornatus]